jgi:hypothetical protein
MVNSIYMANRRKYARPQAILFANNPGIVTNGVIAPYGDELTDFIVLSDDNRESMNMKMDRIEKRVRTVNGRMRSYHIADKLNIDVSWNLLPSRAFNVDASFNADGFLTTGEGINERNLRNPGNPVLSDELFTTDKGAGGVELLSWYENNQGSFWVYLAYDNYKNLEGESKSGLFQYNEVVEMYFADFQYSVEKRGGSNFDFWNISLSLEEV